MKNLHILPTDKPSRLHTWINDKGLRATLYEKPQLENPNTAKNIYITSDEKIKNRDCYIYLGQINKRTRKNSKVEYPFPNYQKIVLTTDQDLINDGVQSIDDEFLEWFVKNPSCEEVEVIPLRKSSGYYDEKEVWHWDFLAYKIIIPKEELKQETIEEAKVDNLIKLFGKDFDLESSDTIKNCNVSFEAGAKWQKEQDKNLYSEDDLLNFGAFVRIEDRKEKRLFLIQDYYKKWKQI